MESTSHANAWVALKELCGAGSVAAEEQLGSATPLIRVAGIKVLVGTRDLEPAAQLEEAVALHRRVADASRPRIRTGRAD